MNKDSYTKTNHCLGIISEDGYFAKIQRQLKRLLNYSQCPRIHIEFKNDGDKIKFYCTFIGFGRLDGCLLIRCDDENAENKILELMNNHDYKCFINNDILYSYRIRTIQILS